MNEKGTHQDISVKFQDMNDKEKIFPKQSVIKNQVGSRILQAWELGVWVKS